MSVSKITTAPPATGTHHQYQSAKMPRSAIAFLALTAAIELLWSHYQLLEGDEFGFGLLGINSNSSLSRLVHIELTTPVSFDPIGYNALIHGLIRLFGATAFAMRLPSMCGYLLMQVCLFYFVRRIATARAATFALALPALAGIVSYSVLSRPYGLLLGLSALAMLSWQTAARGDSHRSLALFILPLSLILAVTTQYYGVNLFVPLCAAELFRTLERRHVDTQMLVSIFAGMAGVLIDIPFARALAPFRNNHVNSVAYNFHFITHSYTWLVVGYANLTVARQHILGLIVVSILSALAISFVRLRSNLVLQLPSADVVFLLTLSAFPVLCYLLANLVTHFVEVRYTQPAIIGIAALLAIMAAPLLQKDTVAKIILASLFLAIVGAGIIHIRSAKNQSQKMLAALVPSAAVQRNLETRPSQSIYVMNHSMFEFISYYSTHPKAPSRLALVYPTLNDYRSGVAADVFKQMDNMRIDGMKQVVPYEWVSKPGTEHLFLLNSNPQDWPNQALAKSHAEIKYLGTFFGADLISARFP